MHIDNFHLARGGVSLPVGTPAHVLSTPRSPLGAHVLARLRTYLEATLGQPPLVVDDPERLPVSTPAVVLAYSDQLEGDLAPPKESPEAFALATGTLGDRPVAVAIGEDDRALKRAVQRLVIASKQGPENLQIPDMCVSMRPWIPEREYTPAGWMPRHLLFYNAFADERMNLWHFSDDQLRAYTEMFDWFGYSGVQLSDWSYPHGIFGSAEAYHEKVRRFADLARELGQNVSLSVTATSFPPVSSHDPDLVYSPAPGCSAFDDPTVRRGFETCYEGFAKLAPLADRLIMHLFDPGDLEHWTDIFAYMRLLEQKVRARKPEIGMAANLWAVGPATTDFLEELVANGFGHYLILEEPPRQPETKKGMRVHEQAARLGVAAGMWGWYHTEYETDQLASFYVNCQVLKEVYDGIRNGPAAAYPYIYWSEMDSHHLNDIYSHYVASQLLWDPDRDPHDLLRELTEGIWGPRNGLIVFDALRLVEDVRSGPSWSTYWFDEKGPVWRFRGGTAEEELRRAETSLAELASMQPDHSFVPKFPLPFPPATLVELMVPHLRQIALFARFRLEIDDVREAARAGAVRTDLAERLTDIWKPIPEYDTWIGSYGQVERRFQDIIIHQVGEELGIEVNPPEWLRAQEAQRLLDSLRKRQRAKRGEWDFGHEVGNYFLWPERTSKDRLDKLLDGGSVEEAGSGRFRLADWDHYAR